jgi:hypothetical protein
MGALSKVLRDKDASPELKARMALKYLELHARSGQPSIDASTNVTVGTDAASIIRALAAKPATTLKDEELQALSNAHVVEAELDDSDAHYGDAEAEK